MKLINSMERIAKKKVIISTPNGFLFQGVHYGNPFQVHLLGWEVDEMQNMGYRVVGFGGWKRLKGEAGKIKWHPKIFWDKNQLAITTNSHQSTIKSL